jgi:hypothetical protein
LAVVTGDLGRRKTDSVREKAVSPDVSGVSVLVGVTLVGPVPTSGEAFVREMPG